MIDFMLWAGVAIFCVCYLSCAFRNAFDELIIWLLGGTFLWIVATLIFAFATDNSSGGSSKCRVCDSTAGYALVGFGPNSKWECKDCRAIR